MASLGQLKHDRPADIHTAASDQRDPFFRRHRFLRDCLLSRQFWHKAEIEARGISR
jgi:hypothetical protein